MRTRPRRPTDTAAGRERRGAEASPPLPADALLALQRTAGNAAVARLVARAPAAVATPRTHVVKAGETLPTLAKELGVSVDALAGANARKLKRWKTPKGERTGFNA